MTTSTPTPRRREPLLQAGQIVGSHRVERMVGRGGLAEVYLVTERSFGVQQALKVLVDADASLVQRLFREGRAQYLLQHPNILRVFSSMTVQERPALLMEFVEGPDLRRWLKQRRGEGDWPSLTWSLTLFHQLLDGMEAAHAAGLVHRDLKPGNIMLELDRQPVRPRIADFGLVKEVERRRDGGETTSVGTMMGTRGYSAPEQLWGVPDVDARADVFSLGCILYLLACQRPPYEGTHDVATMKRMVAEDYADPQALVPDLPDAVALTIRHCLAAERDERLPDCATVRAVLERGAEALRALDLAPREGPTGGTPPSPAPPPSLAGAASEESLHLQPPSQPSPSMAPTHAPSEPGSVSPAPGVRWGLMAGVAGAAVLLGMIMVAVPAAVLWLRSESAPRVEPAAEAVASPLPPSPPAGEDVESPPAQVAPAAEVVASPLPPGPSPRRDVKSPAAPKGEGGGVDESLPSPILVSFTTKGIADPVCLQVAPGDPLYCEGSAPQGRYQIMLDDPAEGRFSAGQVELVSGRAAVITCDPVFRTCF